MGLDIFIQYLTPIFETEQQVCVVRLEKNNTNLHENYF